MDVSRLARFFLCVCLCVCLCVVCEMHLIGNAPVSVFQYMSVSVNCCLWLLIAVCLSVNCCITVYCCRLPLACDVGLNSYLERVPGPRCTP